MKTFIINQLNHLSVINNKLDCKSLLEGQEWLVYTDEGNRIEKLIFFKDKKLLHSINGLCTYSRWEYINSSLSFESNNSILLIKIIAYDNNIIVLNLDGTQNYCFLINCCSTNSLLGCTYSDIQWYLARNCKIDILTEEQRKEYDEEQKQLIEIAKEKHENNSLFLKIVAIIIIVELSVLLIIGLIFF